MRMWMVSPKLLCDKHLLGEHGEIHKHRHVFEKGWSIEGRITGDPQIEPLSMKSRHDELAEEMLARKMNHKSPYSMPDLSKYDMKMLSKAIVDKIKAYTDLISRCSNCNRIGVANGKV